MIAEKGVYRAAAASRLALQTFDEIERLARIGSAIHDVAELDQVSASAGPVQASVEDPGRLQDLDEPLVRAVHVADRDNPLDALDLA